MSRSKRLNGVANAAEDVFEPPEGVELAPQPHLLESLIFLFLVADVLTDGRLVATHCRDKIPTRPIVLPNQVTLVFPLYPRQMNRALTFDETDSLRDCFASDGN